MVYSLWYNAYVCKPTLSRAGLWTKTLVPGSCVVNLGVIAHDYR